MSILLEDWSMADWNELVKWARVGANNAMIGVATKVKELPPHGRLIDADVMRTKIDAPEDETRLLIQWVDAQKTIIPEKEGE